MFRDLARNLYAGARLCFMLPVDRADFRASLDQAFALLVFGSGTILLIEFAAASGNWFPSPDRVGLYALAILTGLIGCFAATRLLGVAERLSTVVVMLLAGAFWLIPVFGPVFALAGEAALAPSSAAGATVAILIVLWCLGIAMRVIQIAAGGGIVKPAVAASILVVFTALPKLLLIPPGTWLGEPAKLPPSWTQENLYYGQFGMVNQAADWLAKGRPGVSDIYFVGFAADAREPVFLNEMRGVTRLFDRRFDTRTRSVVLINNRSTVRQAPLANMHNLGRILSVIGKRIDPEEDIVVLYLSAPALAGGAIKPSFETLDFVPIHAAHIQGMFDDAGIKWRVIILSACATDGFVEQLRGPTTLVIAAAGAGGHGQGCRGDADYTAFGKAFFDEALRGTYSLPDAFERARTLLAAEDKNSLHEPSGPVIEMGGQIAAKLDAVAADLSQRSATAALPPPPTVPKAKPPKMMRP
jgi:hypothetical protein